MERHNERRTVLARDQVLAALINLCGDELAELWRERVGILSKGPLVPDRDPRLLWHLRHKDAALRAVVARWAAARHVAAPWLIDRLLNGLWSVDAPRDMLQDEWIRTSDETCALLDSRGTAKLIVRRAMLQAFRPNDDQNRQFLPVVARPGAETRTEFLARAAAHWDAVAAIRGASPPHKSPDLSRHAHWLIRHVVREESYATIARSEPNPTEPPTVRVAVRRLSQLVEI